MRECRQDTTAEFYPDKVSFDEFLDILISNKESFKQNMESLNIDKELYVENWAMTCLAWNEIEGFIV